MPTRFIYGTANTPDTISVPDGRDPSVTYDYIVYGYGGGDKITGGTGNDAIIGSQSDDFYGRNLSWNGIADTFIGGVGDDYLWSFANNSYLDGGAGDDLIIYSGMGPTASAETTIFGGDGNDQIWALNGAVSYGGNGDDVIVGAGYLDGGYGNDYLITTGVNDLAYGSVGDDSLWAAGSNVLLNGGIGADTIVGNGGNDRLIAGPDQSVDVLIGGSGDGVFQATGRDEFDEGGLGVGVGGTLVAGPEQFASAAKGDLIWNFQIGIDDLVIPTAAYYNPGAAQNDYYSSTSGYNADLGLSGTFITWNYFRAFGGGVYTHAPVVFLAGVTTDIPTLIAAGSLHYSDAVVTY